MASYHLQPGDETTTLVRQIAARLAAGEIGILPTETVDGLFCRYADAAGRERIYRMKQREPRKPLQVMVADVAALAQLGVTVTPPLAALAAACWPGPLTLVVPAANGCEHGVRIPDHPFLLAVLAAVGEPLGATSANLAGQDPVASRANQYADLAEPPDFVVHGPPGAGVASTVARLHADRLELLRPGPLTLDCLTALAFPTPTRP